MQQVEIIPRRTSFKFCTAALPKVLAGLWKRKRVRSKAKEEGRSNGGSWVDVWLCMCMTKHQTKKKREIGREGEKRSSCKSVGGDLQRRPCNLPSTWLDVLWALQNQKRRQAYNTADRSLFMVDGQRCRGEGVCNKAECISPGMKLRWFGGGRREGWWSATNISVCAACVQYAPYVQMCVCYEGEVVADVSVLNDHSACSVREALALHKGVGEEEGSGGGLHGEAVSAHRTECSPQHHASPNTPNYSRFFSRAAQWSVQQRVIELISSLWSTLPCRMNTYWWDIM